MQTIAPRWHTRVERVNRSVFGSASDVAVVSRWATVQLVVAFGESGVLSSGPRSGLALPFARARSIEAIVHDRYGPPDVLELRDVGKPIVKDDEALVRVHAVAVDPLAEVFLGAGSWRNPRGQDDVNARTLSEPASELDVTG